MLLLHYEKDEDYISNFYSNHLCIKFLFKKNTWGHTAQKREKLWM